MPSSPAVHCPTLRTTFVGVQHALSSPELPVDQFRGIKYASIPARFRRSRLHSTYPRVTDAKTHGPIAPQIKLSRLDESLFGFVRQEPSPLVQDEFECLNLLITRPGGINSKAALPVMVWVHGGGNIQGTGSSFLYDAGKLVKTSMELERPVIVVSFNYRLGLLGFAASEALQEQNRLSGEDGVGNYGLYDQINAIHWVRNYISSFGGDPSNITLFGESAGALDIHSILLSTINQARPLAVRAIIQSGVQRPAAVQSVESQTSLLSRIMNRLDVKSIAELRTIPVDVLLSHTPTSVSATDDGVFFRSDWRTRPVPEGITSLIIGDCTFESAIWDGSVAHWTTSGLIRRIRAVIRGVYKADKLLRTYGINCFTYDEDAQDAALNIINDAYFAWPTDQVARGTKANDVQVYRYVFDQESFWRPLAHHGVDLLYLFDNVPTTIPSRKTLASSVASTSSDSDDDEGDAYFRLSDFSYNASRVRLSIQDRWIAFANGQRPWRQSSLYVFGPEGETGERDLEEELGRRRRIDEWRETLDVIHPEMVQKVALELINGPQAVTKARY